MGLAELVIFLVLWVLVPVTIAYWVIRLAVRHAIQDTRRRVPVEPHR